MDALLEILGRRRSIRRFAPQPVEEEKIEALIEAIRRDVRQGTGIELEPEVRIVGVPAASRNASEGL